MYFINNYCRLGAAECNALVKSIHFSAVHILINIPLKTRVTWKWQNEQIENGKTADIQYGDETNHFFVNCSWVLKEVE